MHNFPGDDAEGLGARDARIPATVQFDTRFRVLPKNYGLYGGEKVFDVEEIVVATDTLPFDDYLHCRKWHLTCSIFWNNAWFDDAVALRAGLGIKARNGGRAMMPALETDRGEVGAASCRTSWPRPRRALPDPRGMCRLLQPAG